MTISMNQGTQLDIAVIAMTTNKSFNEIAKDFGISKDAVERFVEEHAVKAKSLISHDVVVKVGVDRRSPNRRKEDSINVDVAIRHAHDMLLVIRTLPKHHQKIVCQYLSYEQDKKSVRYIVMNIIERHMIARTLTSYNRLTIIAEIMEKTGHNLHNASKYFSGYKKLFGGYQDK